jgi:hypothetical protein
MQQPNHTFQYPKVTPVAASAPKPATTPNAAATPPRPAR